MTVDIWTEGAQGRYPIELGSPMTREQRTLRDAVLGFESDFPVLARAAHRTVPATSPMIQWLRDGQIVVNYCSIFRQPFQTPDAPDEGLIDAHLHEHLAAIEQSLTHGTPGREGHLAFVGGAVHYLGRMPDERDTLILRPLRDLMLRRWQRPGGSWVGEWLSEVSLQVR